MKKSVVKLVAALVVATSLMSPVAAQPAVMDDGTVFDAAYYAKNNPDVVSVFGTDSNLLYQHFKNYGLSEGRLPFDPMADLSGIQNDAAITAKILALKTAYPEGTPWPNDATTRYVGYPVWRENGYGCQGFAMRISDAVYGTTAKTNYTYGALPSDGLRSGDLVRYYANSLPHAFVVVSVSGDQITVAEGNYGKKVHWGRKISVDAIKDEIIFVVRRG